jgi:hypothetical protein
MENIQEKIFVHFYNMTVMFVLRLSALLCSLMEVTDKGSFAKGRYLFKNVDAIDCSGSMDGLIDYLWLQDLALDVTMPLM